MHGTGSTHVSHGKQKSLYDGPPAAHSHCEPRRQFRVESLRQEIGLGNATAISSVEMRWHGSNTGQTVTGLELNHSYQIREGEASVITMKVHPINLDHPATSVHELKLQANQ